MVAHISKQLELEYIVRFSRVCTGNGTLFGVSNVPAQSRVATRLYAPFDSGVYRGVVVVVVVTVVVVVVVDVVVVVGAE